MTLQPPGLLDMPNDVLERIIEVDGSPVIIFLLHKVCRKLRDFIEEEPIDPAFKKLVFEIHPDKVEIFYRWNDGFFDSKKYSYKKISENQCGLDRMFGKPKSINMDMVSAGLSDLGVYLKLQYSQMEHFELKLFQNPENRRQVLEKIKKILEDKDDIPLGVQKLVMTISSQDDVIQILPHLEQGAMKNLEIWGTTLEPVQKLEIDKLVKLDHWTRLDELKIRGFYVDARMENFSHLLRAEVSFKKITLEDLKVLKESALAHNFEEFSIKYTKFDDKKQFSKWLGGHFIKENSSAKFWLFHTSVTYRILKIFHNKEAKRIIFSHIGLVEVPEGAVVRK